MDALVYTVSPTFFPYILLASGEGRDTAIGWGSDVRRRPSMGSTGNAGSGEGRLKLVVCCNTRKRTEWPGLEKGEHLQKVSLVFPTMHSFTTPALASPFLGFPFSSSKPRTSLSLPNLKSLSFAEASLSLNSEVSLCDENERTPPHRSTLAWASEFCHESWHEVWAPKGLCVGSCPPHFSTLVPPCI